MTVADPEAAAGQDEQAPRPHPNSRSVRVAALVLCVAVVIAAGLVSSAVYVRPSKGDPQLTIVNMAGSSPFFNDKRVVAVFRHNGLEIRPTSMGSLEVLDQPRLAANFDIASTGSSETGQQVQQKVDQEELNQQKPHHKELPAQPQLVYSSPLVIVTRWKIVHLLEKDKVVKEGGNLLIFNVRKYLQGLSAGKTWLDIPGNRTYPSSNLILVSTTNPEQSDSGMMFAALVSSARLPHHETVPHVRRSDPYLNLARKCFTDQGYKLQHTPELMLQFLTDGTDETGFDPMVAAYENDYIHAWLSAKPDQRRSLTVMYPDLSMMADNTMTSWTAAGNRVAQLLLTNRKLLLFEKQNGYRTKRDGASFVHYMTSRGITTVPSLGNPLLLNTVNLPDASILKKLVRAVDHGQG
jgi:hypothetical protein